VEKKNMEMHGSSHGSGRGQHLRHFTIGVLLLGALALIAVYVWTAPVGFVWHLFHGNFTSFDGQRIPVPGDMWAHLADNGGLTIMREAPKYRLTSAPSGIMMIQHVRGRAPDLSKEYDKIAESYKQPPQGYRLEQVRQVSGRVRNGYCWELVGAGGTPPLWISCQFDKNTLVLDFHGSPEYRDRFYSIVDALVGNRG